MTELVDWKERFSIPFTSYRHANPNNIHTTRPTFRIICIFFVFYLCRFFSFVEQLFYWTCSKKKLVNTNLSQQSEYRIWNCVCPLLLATVKISELFWKEKKKSTKLLRPNLVCPRRKPQHQIYMLWQKLKECRKSNANHKNKINELVFFSILQYYWLLFLCSLFTAYFSFIHSTSMLHKSFAACAYASFIVFCFL